MEDKKLIEYFSQQNTKKPLAWQQNQDHHLLKELEIMCLTGSTCACLGKKKNLDGETDKE